MTKALRFLAVLLLAVPLFAQSQTQRTYSQPELDQMLAPIALYPDALLSQVLMAATYPIEVVEAARWSRANPNLHGDDAVRAVENQDWDPSVKSLVAFPQILQRMDEQLSWTESLGDAFLAQESAVMDSVQHLRQRADAAGNLQSSEQVRVERQGPAILIEPASPQYVYVPYYDPLMVYGTWWWPAYRPVYWAPWPGYARPYNPGVYAGFWWGQPVGLSVNFFFGNVDWRYRRVHVVRPTAYYYRPPVVVNRTVVVERGRWQHDPHHRRGVDYRAPEVRQRFAGTPAERRDAPRQARTPQPRQEAQPQVRPDQAGPNQTHPNQARQDQTRPERREAREEQQRPRSAAQSTERAQQQQREQSQAAERAQRQQAEAARAQQRQQSEAARIQQQQQREREQAAERAQRQQQLQQQRQQSEAARIQQQQQRQQSEAARTQQLQQRQAQRAAMPAAQAPQQPRAERAERQERREERGDGRQEQRQERGQKG